MTHQSQADTIEIAPPGLPSQAVWPDAGTARAQVDLAALSHQGRVRTNNEDHFLIVRFGRMLETLLTNLPAADLPARMEEVGYGLLVADGMGGAAAGEVASRLAISTLISQVLQTPDWIISTGQQEVEQMMQRMAERYKRVDAVLRDQGLLDPALAGMGTTMTLACSLGASVVIGHIGDSRAYLFRDGRLHQLTRDHTLVQSLVDLGCISAEEAARHPYRHMLMRSLGGGDDPSRAEFQRVWLTDRDQLLLCTDGLTDLVDNAGIGSLLAAAATAQEACQALVDLALKNGGRDNVTVVVARYHFPR